MKLRPLRFSRSPYFQNGKISNQCIYRSGVYYTAERDFLLWKQEGKWRVGVSARQCNMGVDVHLHFLNAGLRDAAFPTRREALAALEAFIDAEV